MRICIAFIYSNLLCVNTIPIKGTTPIGVVPFIGGLEEIRTPDPHNANVVRSQLRYKPIRLNYKFNNWKSQEFIFPAICAAVGITMMCNK